MTYLNGFSLQKEETLFDAYLIEGVFTVAGFSYGAQQALEYAYASTTRIDRLILLSPAFFQTQSSAFIRTQLRYFEADKSAYVKQFLFNVAYPSNFTLDSYLNIGTKEELSSLLNYVWDKEKIKTLIQRGVSIEVFIGTQDKIISSQEALTFFSEFCTTYSIKECGHLLMEKI
jgi:pimeloyl-ACP methyl ester carboxylesterase